MKKPTIIILAGGIGKRFKPLITNKLLFPFMGKAFLQHVIEMVEAAGGRDVILVTSPETENWLKSYHNPKLKIRSIIQPQAKGMGDALLKTKGLVDNEPILIMNADDLIDTSFFAKLLETSVAADGFLVGKKVDDYYPAGYLEIKDQQVVAIVEKPGKEKMPSNYVNLVFHYLTKPKKFFDILTKLPASDDQYEKAFSILLKNDRFGFIP